MHSRIATLVLATFGCISAAHAQAPTYDVVFLGVVPGAPTTTYPTAVNDHGVVVGNASPAPLTSLPFVASVGQPPVLLPLLPGYVGGSAYAINNAGVIGGSCGGFIVHDVAVIWTPGPSGYVITQIPALPTTGKFPLFVAALNELGDVVGGAEYPANGFVWNASTGTFDFNTPFENVVSDVNERRQVIAGSKRLDLDTLAVDSVFFATGGCTLREMNDAGVASWAQINFSGTASCGVANFVVGALTYGSKPGIAWTGGIDYAATVAYEDTQHGINDWLHVEDVGNFPFEQRIDPASPGWQPHIASGCGTSANGLIAVHATNATLGLSGPVLLTPQRFHAILEGAPGIEGLPVLAGEGTLQPSSPVKFRLSHANPSSPVGVIAGLSPANLPFYGGTLVPTPTLVLTGLSTDANGKLTLATTWPNGLPSGTKLYLQEWIADASAPFGIAGSNALECVVP